MEDSISFQRVNTGYIQKRSKSKWLWIAGELFRQWSNAFKVLKENCLQPRIPNPAQLLIRSKDKRKALSDRKTSHVPPTYPFSGTFWKMFSTKT